jgi:putative two-component system response regulator
MDAVFVDLGRDYENTTQSPFTDSLTGLHNYGFFMEELKREVTLSHRTGLSFCLALVDVDGLRLQNQRYGTIHGDKVLKGIAGVLRETVRASDLCARYMGDQFILLLQEMTGDAADAFFPRIETAISKRFQNELTVCIGCVSSGDGQDAEELVARAKEALLQAKLQGRGKHTVSSLASQELDQGTRRVLVVDDEPTNIKLLEAMLRHLKYEVCTAANGQEALQAVARSDVDLILLDAMMPVMDGFETCRRLKTNGLSRMIPVIVVTALDDRDSKVRAIEAGADDFMTKPPDRIELMARIRALLRTKKLNESLVSIENVLFSLANAVEAKDAYTQGHVKRVANLAVRLGRYMSLSERDLEALRIGGILHDVGKIGIPDAVLNKPGKLDDHEWELMKAHPDVGYKMAEPLRPILKGALDAIRHHHEKLDGSGYPDGIKGDDVSIIARIMAVADIWDALVTDRPYRKGLTNENALSLLEKDTSEGRLDEDVIRHLKTLVTGNTDTTENE